ncbi:MotE family protein [Stappia sp.]|uniref:MotE family protein n=1 Tax=Stappia sp. TaxID=1870903 RepID=UPI003A9A4F06
MTNLRLIPTLVLAASALFALKLLGFALDGGSHVTSVGMGVAMAQQAEGPKGQDGNAVPAGAGATAAASTQESGDAAQGDAPGESPLPAGIGSATEPPPLPGGLELGGSIAERKVLESLSDRRRELDNREKQFDLRQQLLKSTEERLQKKVDEMAALEASIKSLREAEEKRQEDELRDLVIMYESMKAKDAARIFDRLDLDIMIRVAKAMKPRKMADIMGRMSPEASERLTVALVTGRKPVEMQVDAGPPELPKIMGN